MDYKEKRMEYMNNWPNSEPFEVEKKYYSVVKKIREEKGTIFFPFGLEKDDNVSFNKTVSFIIEAFDQLEKYPNISYEFLFKAYDCFIKEYYTSVNNITDKNKKICDNEWKNVIDSNEKLRKAFSKLFSVIPVKACQYLYIRLSEHSGDNQPYKRVSTDISGSETSFSDKRKQIMDAIEYMYGVDYNNYADSIRKASLMYRYILKNDIIDIGGRTYKISTNDRLHILVSGFLYTLRNDIMHGSSIAITKSSKTTIGTYAIDYYAFMLLYYLVVVLIVNKFKDKYDEKIYESLADNINSNVDFYISIFNKSVDKWRKEQIENSVKIGKEV